MPAKDFSDREAVYLWGRKGKQTIETQRRRQCEDRSRDWITEATVYENSRDTRNWIRFSPSTVRIDAVLPTLWVQTSATQGKVIKVHLLEPPALCLYVRTASANCWSWFEGWLGLLWTLCSDTVFISLGFKGPVSPTAWAMLSTDFQLTAISGNGLRRKGGQVKSPSWKEPASRDWWKWGYIYQ